MAVLGSDGKREGMDRQTVRKGGAEWKQTPVLDSVKHKRKGHVKEIPLLGDGIPSVGSYRHCSSQSP